ncbi:MAG: hypothetical protein L6R41_002376 [Letrouitia leprolyta]|nr:MAG: hypothetical protein L6R41_002376 [Letrouitia leprolyta]
MSSRAAATQPKQHYEKDEKVLCFHGELLYEAKILEVEQDTDTKSYRYRIHYKGWKNTWDDWVENDRLRKLNDENREIAQALKRQYLESTQKATKPTASKRKGLPSDLGSTRGSEERNASAPATGRGQKRGRNADLDEVGSSDFLLVNDAIPSVEDSGPELLAALESSTRASKRRRGPAALDVREPGPAANGGYTLLGTGFYSPTESINGILDKVYAATGTGKLADIGPSAAAQTDLSSSPLSSLSKSPTPPGVLTRSRPSKKAAPKPATNVVAVTTPKTTPPKSSKTDDDNPPKKKHRRIDSNDEELDDSPRTLKKEQEAFEARLQKEVNEIYKTALGNVRVHPDFPHPKAWQDIHEYGTHGYPKQRYIPPARDPPPRRNKKKKPSPQEQQQHKRKRDDNDDANEHDDSQEESFHTRPMIKIPVPDYIKSLLVDDWEEVTKNLALVPLPAPKPVNTIIDEYFEEENEKRFAGSPEMDLLEEVVSGMKEYFDVALGRMLLYRFERQQYLEVRKKWVEGKGEWKGKSCVGDTYGAEHLCRMIVSLPEIVAQTNMDAQSVNRLREEMTKFVNWLSKNTRTYFTADYERANQEYIEKTRAN